MKSILSRLEAQERARARPLPLYVLTFTDGSKRIMDALDAHLYLARLDAGITGTKAIRSAERIKGTLPAGNAWAALERDLEARAGPSN